MQQNNMKQEDLPRLLPMCPVQNREVVVIYAPVKGAVNEVHYGKRGKPFVGLAVPIPGLQSGKIETVAPFAVGQRLEEVGLCAFHTYKRHFFCQDAMLAEDRRVDRPGRQLFDGQVACE